MTRRGPETQTEVIEGTVPTFGRTNIYKEPQLYVEVANGELQVIIFADQLPSTVGSARLNAVQDGPPAGSRRPWRGLAWLFRRPDSDLRRHA
jgi:hypothetical protein